MVLVDPSVDDARFDGLRGAPHLGKLAGEAADAAVLEAIGVQSENQKINGSPAEDTLLGGPPADSINGQDANDTLRGGDGNGGIRGDDGNDSRNGGFDADELVGGARDDIINAVDSAADEITCGPGFDSVTKDRLDRLLDPRACESLG